MSVTRHRVVPGVMLAVVLLGARPSTAQACSPGRFQGHEPYRHDETLPFDFNQPAGWGGQSMAAAQRLVTVHKPFKDVPINAVNVTIDIAVSFQPDRNAATTEQIWGQTMNAVATVPYGEDRLVIFS